MPLRLEELNLPNDPTRPAASALSNAFVENWNAFEAILRDAVRIVTSPEGKLRELEVVGMIETARLGPFRNAIEITHWVYERKALPVEEARRLAQGAKELGDDCVEQMFQNLQKLSKGTPPRRRQGDIRAFEFMLLSEKNTIGRAVTKFCGCGGSHTPSCQVRLKTGIKSVKRILRKYAPDLVSRYDVLHPDRSKKRV